MVCWSTRKDPLTSGSRPPVSTSLFYPGPDTTTSRSHYISNKPQFVLLLWSRGGVIPSTNKPILSLFRSAVVSASKPSGGPCHTIGRLFPALVDSGIKCHHCRCRAPPSVNNSTKTIQNCQDSRIVAAQVPHISSTGTLRTIYHFISVFIPCK